MITKPTKYHEKWMLKELKDWYKTAKADKSLLYIKQLCEDKQYCYEDIESAKRLRVKENGPLAKEISRTWNKVKSVFEARVAVSALNGKLNPNISQLYLKHNYNWIDKQVTENKHTLEKVKDEDLREDLAKEVANLSE